MEVFCVLVFVLIVVRVGQVGRAWDHWRYYMLMICITSSVGTTKAV